MAESGGVFGIIAYNYSVIWIILQKCRDEQKKRLTSEPIFYIMFKWTMYYCRRAKAVQNTAIKKNDPKVLTFVSISKSIWARGGIEVSEVRVGKNESLDSALRRFKRTCQRSGVMSDIRKHEHYEKPSVRRKKKSEAARKRKWN